MPRFFFKFCEIANLKIFSWSQRAIEQYSLNLEIWTKNKKEEKNIGIINQEKIKAVCSQQ